ncbi:MAG: ATP cone domain-containing protein [Candidatus Pacebacteria bacterium]|nr:ATP cone domain-containing protein [Candidatus Paceibacterota bacterium]
MVKTGSGRVNLIKSVKKRDGQIVDFDLGKITSAINKSMTITGEGSIEEADLVANKVLAELVKIAKKFKDFVPDVEGIQDIVERELILSEYVKSAKEYIIYRQERSKLRIVGVQVPPKVKKLAADSKSYFKNQLGEFVYYRTYSKWIEDEERRETWIETVDRYLAFMKKNIGNLVKENEYKDLREAILNQEIMPSMRLLQFAGPAVERTNVCAYNCSFIAPSKLQDFAEIMYISMCGTGVGFSVESQNIQALPQIKFQTNKKLPKYVVGDSKEGWADALSFGLKTWFDGNDVDFDYSQVRPAGARLKTMGGRASGPEPLIRLLNLVRRKVISKQGRRLTNLDAHDIICSIGDCVVSGGVRRSALISLSDFDDEAIRDSKKGQFYLTEPQRSIANNSAVYLQKPTSTEFFDEWIALMKSGTGERGIFNRGGLAKTLPERRIKALGGDISSLGTNPCGEIILQSKQFCNLSEVVARDGDTEKDLLRKIKLATLLGTYQSTLTKFGYLSKDWKENCEKERLLGVSITGQWDCPTVRNADVLKKLRKEAVKANEEYAKRFKVNASTCVTCVKPSGTVSQTVDCSSGMHTRYAPFYIRRIRISATDSLFKMLRDQGVPYQPEVGQSKESATTYVFEFPVKAPKDAVVNADITAIDQLEFWKMVKLNYTEHNPSVTIYVSENEWIEVANWLYSNWEIIGGLSFLPRSEHVYQLAPYEEINEEKYNEMIKKLGDIDFSKIITYERQDETEVKKEMACAGGMCEIV